MTSLLRRSLLVLSLVVLSATVYLLAWPVPIEPMAWDAPTFEGYSGPHAPNDRLAGVETIPIGDFRGPEDLAIDASGRVYTGTLEGPILRFEEDVPGPTPWVDTGGRPLGLAFGPEGHLYVADVVRGLLRVTPEGEVEVLAREADGVPIHYANNVDVAADGTVYFSEASNKFGRGAHDPEGFHHYQSSLYELMEHGGTGRVMRWSPGTGKATTLLDGLTHPNGVALTGDDAALLVNVTGSYRVLRLELTGDAAGDVTVIAENLPGFPDNLTRGRDGRFWMALVSPRNALLDRLSGRPFLRKVVQRLPEVLRPKAIPFTHLIAIDEQGGVLEDLQDPDGTYPYPTAAAESERYLYLASVKTAALARIEKSKLGL